MNRKIECVTRAACDRANALKGQKFGLWTVIGNARGRTSKNGGREHGIQVDVQCECGLIRSEAVSRLVKGKTKRCRDCSKRMRSQEKFAGIPGRLWNTIKRGAIKRNLEFDLTPQYAWELFVGQHGLCALSGVPIVFDYYNKRNTTASLDRVDNDRGYLADNIQWVHKDINRMKWVLPQDYFINMCRSVADTHREPDDCDPDWGSDE